MLENLNKKQKTIFGIVLIFMIGIIVYYIYSSLNNINYNSDEFSDNMSTNDTEDSEIENVSIDENVTEAKEIIVHVSGCVKEEKIVSLPDGSRVNDAIESAGGLTKDADLSKINLAYILEDGEKIYVPKKGENVSDINSPVQIEAASSSFSNKATKININKATQAELETIPGIGPSTALKIINYRNANGKFKSIEDIKSISGIGNAKYEKMKDYISIK